MKWLEKIWAAIKPNLATAAVAAITALATLWLPDWFPRPAPIVPDPDKPPTEKPIVGPAVVAPGRVAILSSTGAQFTAQAWRLVNSDQPIEALAADKIAFATDTKGIYWFTVAGIRKRDKTPTVYVHRLIVDANPNPEPEPGPNPEPPPAPDGFQSALQSAYRKESDPDKAQLRAAFAAFYRRAAESTASTQIETWGQLFEVAAAAATEAGIAGKLPDVQNVVKIRLESALPSKGAAATPINAAGRELARKTFAAVAAAFEALR